MWRPMRLFVCVALMLSCSVAAHAAGDGSFRIFDWVGRAYWNKHEKQLDRCAAQTTNADKITIAYSLDRHYVWSLEFSSASWRFNKGASFEIAFGVGHARFVRLRAIAADPQTVRVQIPDSLSFFEALRKIFRIQLIAGGMRSRFDLVNNNQVLTALTQCVVRYGTSGKDRASIARWIKSSAAAAVAGHDPAIRKEAEALVAKIMREAELPKAGKPAADETAGIAGDAFGKIGKIVLGLTVVQKEDAPPLADVPALLAGADAQRCRGDYFSAALTGTVDKLKIARAFTSCLAQQAVKSAYYLAVPRKSGGIYVIALVTNDVDIVNADKLTGAEVDRRIRASIAIALEKMDQASSH